jgi:hypothetical protein
MVWNSAKMFMDMFMNMNMLSTTGTFHYLKRHPEMVVVVLVHVGAPLPCIRMQHQGTRCFCQGARSQLNWLDG